MNNERENISKKQTLGIDQDLQDSIEWLCSPQMKDPILQYENDFVQINTTNTTNDIDTNDILHNNIQKFVDYYGVIDKKSQNKYIKDIRKLIFNWIQIDNINIDNVQEKSTQLFTQMSEIKDICSKKWFDVLDTLL
jgi:hypothetical protein|tara:strand:- start:1168 stop:1575 length:408 start_codon:yes stop_codon:yes gene_type:complete